MKKISAFLLVALMLLSLCACGESETITPDYENVAAFEAALNAGEDLTGKTVRITVDNLVPNSAFGYNIQTGEHLNFCSTSNPKVSTGDSLIVKTIETSSMLGSWIISYEVVG